MIKDPVKRKAYDREYYYSHKGTEQFRQRRIRQRRREKQIHQEYFERILDHYGRKCACCGETTPMFLTVDHINGGGLEHRRQISNKLYRWIVLNNFPDGFGVLCYNCNCGKWRNHGVCPHQESKLINNLYVQGKITSLPFPFGVTKR